MSDALVICHVDRGQQAGSSAGAKMPPHVGCKYLPRDDVLLPPAEDMVNDTGERSEIDGQMWHQNPTSFPTTDRGLRNFESWLRMLIIRQQ